MNEIYVNVKGLEIEELFDKDLVSIEELVEKLIDINYEIRELKEKFEEKEEYDDWDRADEIHEEMMLGLI